MTDPTDASSQEVFHRIALSLSGGGYRAATFHLGTLSTLSKLGLLNRVQALSTVSGGTIVGAAWALSIKSGTAFPTFADEFKSFLRTTNVIQSALDRLKSASTINGFVAMPSLIRGAAQTYRESAVIGNAKFKDLAVTRSTQLQDIAFNSTDFRSGNSFRFQQGDSAAVYTGNQLARVKSTVDDAIGIADIVAASSCFPGGFEPIRFPSDFSWGGAPQLEKIKSTLGAKFDTDIPLMDGGVYDNQGIDSISLIFERKDKEIELYIISDTSQRKGEYLKMAPQPKRAGLPLWGVSMLSWLLMMAAGITVISVAVDAYAAYSTTGVTLSRLVFLYAIPTFLSAGTAYGLYRLRKIARKFLTQFNVESGIDVWACFQHVSVPAAVELLMTRFKSVAAMTTSVFMKRIRDLGYKRIFGDADFEKKRISNMIYDLDNESEWRDYVADSGITPSAKLRKVARVAEAYGTNLWFTKEEDLNNLFECGEATMCFNILRYLLECRPDQREKSGSSEFDLYKRAHEYWVSIQ